MRILGADVRGLDPADGSGTVVALDGRGAVSGSALVEGYATLAREVSRFAQDEPFLLAVDVAVVAPAGSEKSRRPDRWLQRRLGIKLPPARPGADLIAALATAGLPCLPYPDRDRRRSGLAEVHPEAVLKALAWEASAAAEAAQLPDREAVLRAVDVPVYRGAKLARSPWAARWAAVDAAVRVAGSAPGYDLEPVRDALRKAVTVGAVDRAASLLDAVLLAGTARRYLEEPERCAFVGERDRGYAILPANALVRRAVLRETVRPTDRPRLFPKASLEQRLRGRADLKPLELFGLPGRAQRLEAVFEQPPLYEFDNLDEMLWWKHCRHLDGLEVPPDGLTEMVVRLDGSAADAGTLRLIRSRHKTLSFRFEPPQAWRAKLAPRDGRTYPMRILRAVYEVN